MVLGLYNHNGEWEPYETVRRNYLFLGKPRTGITETLTRLALDDIHNDLPVVFIGKIGRILDRIPFHRRKDALVFNPEKQNFALNLIAKTDPQFHSLIAGEYTEAFKSISFDSKASTANVDQYFKASIQTLLTTPEATLLHILTLLTDPTYREKAVQTVTDPYVLSFWEYFEARPEKDRAQLIESTINKLWTFSFEPLIRESLGQKTNHLTFKDKIVLIELPETRIGRENAALLGTLILAFLVVSGAEGVKTNLYVDDASRFGMTVIRDLLKTPGICTQLGLKYLYELDEPEMLMGAVDQIVAFRISGEDAKKIESEFYLGLQEHLYDQPDFHAYLAVGARSVQLQMPMMDRPVNKGAAKKILGRNLGEYTRRGRSG